MMMSAVFVLLFELFIFCTCRFSLATASSSQVDQSTYEQGKKQYELIQHQAELPRYGQCWKDAMIFTHSGCAKLTDDVQGRLALAYLNCFLELQGRTRYECGYDQPLQACTQVMDDADRGSFTTFFTHTQNICYFLRAQVWNEATEKTISTLAESSSHVASQLRESSLLQAEMMKQQNDSLDNQKILIDSAANLTNVLTVSSGEINRLFQTFKQTTKEQRLLIADVFDQLTSLKQMVLGEFTGFYSILYYFFSVLVCYLLTSTTRTSGARLWLFGIVTASIFCEYLVTAWVLQLLAWSSVASVDHDSWVYWTRSCCRKLFAGCGLVVLGLCAYNYRDINTANNQLLVEIRKQNSDLKCLLYGAPLLSAERKPKDSAAQLSQGVDSSEPGTSSETDSRSETHSMHSDSDRTFILRESEPSVSETDSYLTAETLHSSSLPSRSSHGRESLMQELRNLRSATPLKEMAGLMDQWIHTGTYSPPEPGGPDMNGSISGSPYFLRPRRGRPMSFSPPAAQVESPQSFAKTVRQLQRISEQNSKMVVAAVSAKRT